MRPLHAPLFFCFFSGFFVPLWDLFVGGVLGVGSVY
jgi:hypothetical protein